MFSVSNRLVIVDDRHEVYSIDRSVYGSVFEYPINKIDGKIDFRAAPFVGVSFDDNYINGGYGCAPAVLYDATHRQFLVIRNNSTYLRDDFFWRAYISCTDRMRPCTHGVNKIGINLCYIETSDNS